MVELPKPPLRGQVMRSKAEIAAQEQEDLSKLTPGQRWWRETVRSIEAHEKKRLNGRLEVDGRKKRPLSTESSRALSPIRPDPKSKDRRGTEGRRPPVVAPEMTLDEVHADALIAEARRVFGTRHQVKYDPAVAHLAEELPAVKSSDEVGGGLNGEWFGTWPFHRPKQVYEPAAVCPAYVRPAPDPYAEPTRFDVWCSLWPEGPPKEGHMVDDNDFLGKRGEENITLSLSTLYKLFHRQVGLVAPDADADKASHAFCRGVEVAYQLFHLDSYGNPRDPAAAGSGKPRDPL